MTEGKMGSAVLSVLLTAAWVHAAVPNIGTRRELFVDECLVETMTGCELRLHHPIPREVALVHDAPWEGNLSCFHTVFKDGDLYRMYYRGTQLDCARGSRKKHVDVTCYAESEDGIHWRKPELGFTEFKGSRKNNIIFQDDYFSHNFAPFLDPNPDCPADRRYKAFAGHKKDPGLFAFVSPDGIHWTKLPEGPVLTDGAFDSQNLAFWDPVRKEYRAYFRDFRRIGGVRMRDIKTAVSKDFVNWSEPEWCTYPGAPDEQLYTNQTIPYPRAPHLFVAFPMRYVDHGGRYSFWQDTHNHWPNIEQRKQRFASGGSTSRRYGTAVTDALFMTSRDGRTFSRWREAFLRPRPGSWAYCDSMFAWQLVETASDIPGIQELSIYALEGGWTGASTTLRRYTLRLDGFVSVHAGGEEAEMVTKPLVFGGKALELNLATSAAGSVRVEIQAEDGAPAPGFALEDCPPIVGDSVDRIVSWEGGTDLSHLAGKPVRLRLALVDADLYAMRFLPETPDVAFAPQQMPTYPQSASRIVDRALSRIAKPGSVPTVEELAERLRMEIRDYRKDGAAFTRPEYAAGVKSVLDNITAAVLRVPRCEEAPAIDGKCNAKEWQSAATVDRFTVITRGQEEAARLPEYATTARVAYDADALYICFVCREKDVGELILDQGGRDSRTWRNDAVEFAFSPDLKSRYHLIMNAAGEIYDAVDGNARWNASATVAVGKNAAENTWTVEVALPWRDLGVEPACGMICRGNLGRENMTQGGAKWFENNECSSWCRVVTGGLNNPGSMGVFILE